MIEILSFPKINTLNSLPNIQLFGDAELDIVVLISHAVIVCICNITAPKSGTKSSHHDSDHCCQAAFTLLSTYRVPSLSS